MAEPRSLEQLEAELRRVEREVARLRRELAKAIAAARENGAPARFSEDENRDESTRFPEPEVTETDRAAARAAARRIGCVVREGRRRG